MTQEELLKALKGGSGREQVNFDPAQISLRPTIQRGGQYNVQVQQAPQTNPALQLADALKGGSQVLNQFVDIQTKQGEIEANALTPEEVIKRVEQGDPEAGSFLDKLGKEKTFVETTYKRYYNSTVQPKLASLGEELKNRPMQEYAEQGITTQEDFKAYAEWRVKELTDKFGEYTNKSPYAKVLHNQLIEEVVPKLVQQQTSNFDANVSKFNKDEVIANLAKAVPQNGVNPAPTAAKNVPTTIGARITQFGQTGVKGGVKDSLLDSNSALGIGFRVPPDEQAKIKKGLPSIHKMKAGDIGVSPDIRAQLEAEGVQYMDTITVKLEDGTTHTGRWMDVTAEVFEGKNMSGRFDLYTPEGNNPLDGKKVTGWSTDEATADNRFNENVNNIYQINAEALLNRAQESPTNVAKILRKTSATEVQTLTKEGKFAEARKLLGAINNVKLGGQPLFGSIAGRATYVELEDLVDQQEDQFSADNSREEEKRNKDLTAKYEIDALKQIYAGTNSDEVYQKQKAEILAREDLSDYQRSSIIKNLDQAQSQQFQANLNSNKAVESTIKQYGLGDQVMKTAVVANQPSDAYDYMSLKFPKETMDAIVTKDLNNQTSIKPGAVQLLSQTIQQAQYATDESLFNISQQFRAGNEIEYGGVTYDISTEAKKRTVGAKLSTILNKEFDENIKTSFMNNINSSQFKQAAAPAMSNEEQALYDAKLLEYGGDAKLAKIAVENEKRKINAETSVVNKDGTVRYGRSFAENPYDFATKANNALTKGLIKNPKGEQDFDAGFKVFSAAKYEVHNSQAYGYDLKDYYGAPIGSKQQSAAVRNIRASFEQVGFPVDAVQSGVIQKQIPNPAAPNQMQTVLFSIEDDYLRKPEAYKVVPIIPAHWLQRRDEPAYSSAIQKFTNKWGISDEQIADQETLYQSRGIKVTK